MKKIILKLMKTYYKILQKYASCINNTNKKASPK